MRIPNYFYSRNRFDEIILSVHSFFTVVVFGALLFLACCFLRDMALCLRASALVAAIGGKSRSTSEKGPSKLLRNHMQLFLKTRDGAPCIQVMNSNKLCNFSYIVHSCAYFMLLEYFQINFWYQKLVNFWLDDFSS